MNEYVRTRVYVEGLREITEALSVLPRAAAKKILQRATMAAMEPMRAEAERLAPNGPRNVLKRSIILSDKSQRKGIRKYRSDLKSSVQVYMGPASRVGAYPESVHQEFGVKPHTIKPKLAPYLMIKTATGFRKVKEIRHPGNAPHPFMRPAYDMHAQACVAEIGENVGAAVMAYAANVAKKSRRKLKIG